MGDCCCTVTEEWFACAQEITKADSATVCSVHEKNICIFSIAREIYFSLYNGARRIVEIFLEYVRASGNGFWAAIGLCQKLIGTRLLES